VNIAQRCRPHNGYEAQLLLRPDEVDGRRAIRDSFRNEFSRNEWGRKQCTANERCGNAPGGRNGAAVSHVARAVERIRSESERLELPRESQRV
jgi:hypothetical protein